MLTKNILLKVRIRGLKQSIFHLYTQFSDFHFSASYIREREKVMKNGFHTAISSVEAAVAFEMF